MKFLLLSFILVFAGVAFAQPESISLVCDGHQPMSGGAKEGKVIVQASTPGIYTYGSSWKIDVSWQGEKNPLVTSGVACGENLPANTQCYVKRSGAGLPFEVTQECDDMVYNGGVPHSKYISSIVLDNDHGYFNCQGPNAADMHIQLANCQSVP